MNHTLRNLDVPTPLLDFNKFTTISVQPSSVEFVALARRRRRRHRRTVHPPQTERGGRRSRRGRGEKKFQRR